MKISAWMAKVVRGMVHAAVRFYYPRIEVGGVGTVPSRGPVLLVANHPNSVLDPVVLGIAAGRPVRFLAKAPLFAMPVFGALIRDLGMIPAYRGRDSANAREDVAKNLASLATAATALGDQGGAVVGVFPGGHQSRRSATGAGAIRCGEIGDAGSGGGSERAADRAGWTEL